MAKDFAWKYIDEKFVSVFIKIKFRTFMFSAYPYYLSSPFHINYQLKMLTSNQLQLRDIIYNTSSLTYFIEVKKYQY